LRAFTGLLQALLAREARGSLQPMNATEIRAELDAVKAALRADRTDLVDLLARTRRACSSLAVLIAQGERPMAPLLEHDLRELIALCVEVQATLETAG
jgi:hypothetical protein